MRPGYPDGNLSGRVVMVTGAGRGIGRAIALMAATGGAHVAVNDLDVGAALETVAAICDAGGTAVEAAGSITELDLLPGIVERVQSVLGPIDALVNNAGVPSSGKQVHRTEPAEVDELFRVHALGPFALCKSVLPGMRSRRTGSIVMISSESTAVAPSHGAPYTMAKSALEGLARTLANENQPFGIRVNVVAPGVVDTRLGHLVLDRIGGGPGPQPADIPMIDPSTVARTVCFLLSDASIGITGERLTISAQQGATTLPVRGPRYKEFA